MADAADAVEVDGRSVLAVRDNDHGRRKVAVAALQNVLHRVRQARAAVVDIEAGKQALGRSQLLLARFFLRVPEAMAK